MQNTLSKLTLIFILLSSTLTLAQENPEPGVAIPSQSEGQKKKKSQGSKSLKLDFVDEMIEGNSDKPYEMMLMTRPDQNLKRILKFREHYNKEMDASFDDIR